MAKLPEYMYSVTNKESKDSSFVNGNTKKLIDCNQKDLETIFNNGDKRISRKGADSKTVTVDPVAIPKP